MPQPTTVPSMSAPKPVSAKDIVVPGFQARPEPFSFNSNLDGALWWFAFGYRVIPLIPGQKRPATTYHPWLDQLTAERIRQHWRANPGHEVGAVLDETQLVLDADSESAHAALLELEKRFGLVSSLVIKTRRGYHHHYRLHDRAFAKPDSHSTEEFPKRIDVRAGKCKSACNVDPRGA